MYNLEREFPFKCELADAPKQPGVYAIMSTTDEVQYIGEATDIHDRLNNQQHDAIDELRKNGTEFYVRVNFGDKFKNDKFRDLWQEGLIKDFSPSMNKN